MTASIYTRMQEVRPDLLDELLEGYKHPSYALLGTVGPRSVNVCHRCGAVVASQSDHDDHHRNLTIAIGLLQHAIGDINSRMNTVSEELLTMVNSIEQSLPDD